MGRFLMAQSSPSMTCAIWRNLSQSASVLSS